MPRDILDKWEVVMPANGASLANPRPSSLIQVFSLMTPYCLQTTIASRDNSPMEAHS